MKKLGILAVIISLLFSCTKHHSKKNPFPLDELKEKKDFYISQVQDVYSYLDRCDALTFVGAWDAYSKNIDIFAHEYSIKPDGSKEYKSGKWNRDIEPCYGTDLDDDGYQDSRSGISLEAELGALHAIWARKDLKAINRFIIYAEEHAWVLNDGPREYTFLPQLSLVAYKIKENISSKNLRLLSPEEEDGLVEVLSKLKGYRGKVIAYYLDLKAKVYGYLLTPELTALEAIYLEDQENPIYNALIGRYRKDSSDYTQKAIDVLLNEEHYASTIRYTYDFVRRF